MTRPSWDEYFFKIAQTVSLRASCSRASVGVVIVSKDNRILATGYNGAPSGADDCLTAGCLIEDNHCQRAAHGEVNAIAAAAKYGISLEGAKMYIYDNIKNSARPHGSCRECKKLTTAVGLDVYP